MDSSNSQHSHSQPTNSASNPSSGSSSGYGSGSGGSISPSAENSPLEGDNSSSSMQMKSSTPEDMDVDMDDSSTSTKPQPKPSSIVDTTIASSSSSREGKAEEIGLLVDLYNLHNKTGRYHALISSGNEQRDFYKFWIQEEGDYANKKELDEKINELHERFLKNMDKNVEGPTDPVDVEILRLSEWIWGNEIDSCEKIDAGDDQEEDVNVVDDGDHDGADPDGSSKQRDSSKESGGLKDSSLSKANGNGSAAS